MEIGTINNRYGRLASQEATEKLKQLIKEHPDYPIVVLVGEYAACPDYSWTYASTIRVGTDLILDCNTPWWTDEHVCTDEDEFQEHCEEMIWERFQEEQGREPTNEEMEAAWKEVKKAHDPYWKKVISISADN